MIRTYLKIRFLLSRELFMRTMGHGHHPDGCAVGEDSPAFSGGEHSRGAASTHAANHHEVTLVQLTFDFYMIEAKPENLIGDKAYDSDHLDEELRRQGIRMIAPHRSNRRKLRTQDGRRLRRHQRR